MLCSQEWSIWFCPSCTCTLWTPSWEAFRHPSASLFLVLHVCGYIGVFRRPHAAVGEVTTLFVPLGELAQSAATAAGESQWLGWWAGGHFGCLELRVCRRQAGGKEQLGGVSAPRPPSAVASGGEGRILRMSRLACLAFTFDCVNFQS